MKISFTNEDEIKTFSDKQKQNLDIKRPILQAEERLEMQEGKKGANKMEIRSPEESDSWISMC